MAKVWVPPYIKANGTRVKGFWRSTNGGTKRSLMSTLSDEDAVLENDGGPSLPRQSQKHYKNRERLLRQSGINIKSIPDEKRPAEITYSQLMRKKFREKRISPLITKSLYGRVKR